MPLNFFFFFTFHPPPFTSFLQQLEFQVLLEQYISDTTPLWCEMHTFQICRKRQAETLTHQKTSNVTQITSNSLTMIVIILIMLLKETTRFKLSQLDFSVKVKGQANRRRHINKRASRCRETRNILIDFIGSSHKNRVVDKSKRHKCNWKTNENVIYIKNVHKI